jgi:putative membrane protein
MIVRERPNTWQLLFVMRGSIVPRIAPQIGVVTALSLLVVTLQDIGAVRLPPIAALPFSLIGIALSIFAAFRNTVCYDRWWEARKILGQLLVDARSLGRQALVHIGPGDAVLARRMVLRCCAFAYLLRDYLRGDRPGAEALAGLGATEAAVVAAAFNPANVVLLQMSRDIARAEAAALFPPQVLLMMEERVVSLSAVLAAGERIKGVPVPYAYSLLLHRTAYLFCFLLPFGLAAAAGFWTPIVAAIVSYTFFGLDALGGELETPFGRNQNALPLDAMVRFIDINLREILGETELPKELKPVDDVLL